jgi:hypothetical protein
MALLPPSCAVNIAKVPHLSPFHRGSRSASSSPPTGQGAQPPCPCPGWRTHARWSLRHVRLCATALAGSAIRARCTATAPEEYLVPTARRRRHKRAGGNIPIRGRDPDSGACRPVAVARQCWTTGVAAAAARTETQQLRLCTSANRP